MIKVQIYLNTPEDALMAASAGANFIGIVCDGENLMAQSLSYPDARAVYRQLPEDVMLVSLTISSNPKQILEMCSAIHPQVIHLAATKPLTTDQIKTIRQSAPDIKIMQTIPVNLGDPIEFARTYQPVSDYFLLDTADPQDTAVGATGKVHDWRISASLVQTVNIPVFLAGGLSPQNVQEAVQIVKPWGVDSYSQTNKIDSPHQKDPQKVKDFIKNARRQNDR